MQYFFFLFSFIIFFFYLNLLLANEQDPFKNVILMSIDSKYGTTSEYFGLWKQPDTLWCECA